MSAQSSRMSAQANGCGSGCLGSGCATQAHDSTAPPGPTSTISPVSSPVVGSYSVGGTITLPPDPVAPRNRPSRSAVRKAPMTGPTDREYGYSSECAACRTSLSDIPDLPLALASIGTGEK